MDKLLIIFVKNPEPGKVKTRLAAVIGDQAAMDIYSQLLRHTRSVAIRLLIEKVVFYGNSFPPHDLWSEVGFPRLMQEGEGIGERMRNAINWGFRHAFSRIVLVGSDIPGLSHEILLQAFRQLAGVDVVLGPAKDGGYYLVGMNEPHDLIFSEMEWSTANVLKETIARLEKAGKTVFLLPELNDVDTVEDLEGTGLMG